MTTKIKIFSVSKDTNYEETVNEFLKDKLYVDIKFRDIDSATMEVIVVYRDRNIVDVKPQIKLPRGAQK